MYQVYILFSKKTQKFYTGISSDTGKRLYFHNQGLNTSTKSGLPWNQIWVSEEMEKSAASLLERKIKKRGAKRYLTDIGNIV